MQSSAVPVSAFARRKAAGITTFEEGPALVVDDSAEPEPPRKKRKGGRKKMIEGEIAEIPPAVLSDEGVSEDDSVDVEPEMGSDSKVVVAAQNLSRFTTERSVILEDTDSKWTVRLHHRDSLAILGHYDLWVRSGAISIAGALIHASSKLHRVYAPSTHSIPIIRPVSNPFGTGNPPCQISFVSCGSRIRLLQRVTPKFGRIWNSKMGIVDKRSFINIQHSIEDPYKRALRALEPPNDWQSTISKLTSEANTKKAIMVCGPKGSGKSTFCRYLVNAILSMAPARQQISRGTEGSGCVAFLDLDPGQPEYSPPGELSLHALRSTNLGPPFTHPAQHGRNDVVRAHHFGHLSLKEDPDHYLKCALDLFHRYKKLVASIGACPVVVNCSGWIQGSGLELLNSFIRGMDLTDVIYTSTSGPEDVVEALKKVVMLRKTSLHQLSSQGSDMVSRTAADLRMMQTLSYFHLGDPELDNLRWDSSPLASVPPLVVHYAGPKQGLKAVLVLGDQQNPDFMTTVLDGCIVGLAVIEGLDETRSDEDLNGLEVDIDSNSSDHLSEPAPSNEHMPRVLRNSQGIPYIASRHHTTIPPSPTTSYCIGQALIRGIDTTTKTFQIITPVPAPALQAISKSPHQQILLVKGKLDTPTWAYAEQMHYEKALQRRREHFLGEQGEDGVEFMDSTVRQWADMQPWTQAMEPGVGRKGSGKVRKVRRDIRYKN